MAEKTKNIDFSDMKISKNLENKNKVVFKRNEKTLSGERVPLQVANQHVRTFLLINFLSFGLKIQALTLTFDLSQVQKLRSLFCEVFLTDFQINADQMTMLANTNYGLIIFMSLVKIRRRRSIHVNSPHRIYMPSPRPKSELMLQFLI